MPQLMKCSKKLQAVISNGALKIFIMIIVITGIKHRSVRFHHFPGYCLLGCLRNIVSRRRYHCRTVGTYAVLMQMSRMAAAVIMIVSHPPPVPIIPVAAGIRPSGM